MNAVLGIYLSQEKQTILKRRDRSMITHLWRCQTPRLLGGALDHLVLPLRLLVVVGLSWPGLLLLLGLEVWVWVWYGEYPVRETCWCC
jgi:hypothetical protein